MLDSPDGRLHSYWLDISDNYRDRDQIDFEEALQKLQNKGFEIIDVKVVSKAAGRLVAIFLYK